MTRFTIKGWIQLPFAIVLRVPFAITTSILNLIAKGFESLAYYSELAMSKMPTVEYRKEWVEAENHRLRQRAIAEWKREWTKGSQVENA